MYTYSSFMCKLRTFQFKFFVLSLATPYHWNPQTKLYKLLPNPNLTRRFHLEAFFILIYCFHLFFQFAWFTHCRKINETTFLGLSLIAFGSVTLQNFLMIWRRDDYLTLINGMSILAEKINSKIFARTKIIKNRV